MLEVIDHLIFKNYKTKILLLIIFLNLHLHQNIKADLINSDNEINQPDTTQNITHTKSKISYFYEPFPLEVGNFLYQIGASFTLLPIPVMENEYVVPSIDFQCKLGVFKNICLVGSLYTNIFSNFFQTGLQWNVNYGKFSFGLANHFGGFLGFITLEGQFESNTAYAYCTLPIIRFGYRWDDAAFSLTFAGSYVFKGTTKIGAIESNVIFNNWNDFYYTLAIEQPFLKKYLISVGISVAYQKSPYQSWLLYNTFNHFLFTPEIFIAIQL